MAQGAIKKGASTPKANSQRKQTGARIIKPKKAALIKQQKLKKVRESPCSKCTQAVSIQVLANIGIETFLRTVSHD